MRITTVAIRTPKPGMITKLLTFEHQRCVWSASHLHRPSSRKLGQQMYFVWYLVNVRYVTNIHDYYLLLVIYFNIVFMGCSYPSVIHMILFRCLRLLSSVVILYCCPPLLSFIVVLLCCYPMLSCYSARL